MVTHGDVDALTCDTASATLHRHRCPCGRLASLAGALPGELLSVVASGAAPSVRAARVHGSVGRTRGFDEVELAVANG